jgi:hypothetical protein
LSAIVSGLTTRTEVGRAAANDDALYRSAAVEAGLVDTPVGVKTIEVVPCSPVGQEVGKVVEAGAAIVDRVLEDHPYCPEERATIAGVEGPAWSERVDTRCM